MVAGTSFCLIVSFLVCTALKMITAKRGQDVILPCKVPNNINVNNIRAVKWSRPDQDPKYVLLYRDGHLDPHDQHPSYQNRVYLQDKEMKDGDVSLILKNVTMEDRGTYECRVFEEGKDEPIIINLEVHPSGDKGGIIGDGGDKDGGDKDGGDKDGGDKIGIIIGSVVGVILLVVAAVGFLIYRQQMKKNQHRPVPPVAPSAIEMPTVPGSPVEPPQLLYL